MRSVLSVGGLVGLTGIFAVSVLGCGGFGIPNLGQIFPGGGSGALLVGTWKTQSVSDGTNTVDCPGTLTDSAGSYQCYQEVRTYYPTGSWITTAPTELLNTGNWTINGSSLTVTSKDQSFTGNLTFDATGKTLQWDVNGITTTATRQ